MSEARAIEAQQRRIEALVVALETLDDPRAREPAQELLQVVLDLHAQGLTRLLEILSVAGALDDALSAAFERDAAVSALLLLHGLHPQDLPTRAACAVAKMRPLLGAQGIQIELMDAAQEAVSVRVSGCLQGKHSTVGELRQDIEHAIFELVPEALRVEIAGLAELDVHELRFVPQPTYATSRTEAGAR